MKNARMLFLMLVMSIVFVGCGGATAPQAAPTAAPAAADATAAPAAADATAAPAAANAATAAPAAADATAAAPAAGSAPIKLVVFGPQGTDQDLVTNSFTKEAEQKFNLQFEWQTTTYDGASAKEKRQISLA
ncbi:MAG: hypothetical protein ABIV47_23965, partial [Roseiflexaceae bacterium]